MRLSASLCLVFVLSVNSTDNLQFSGSIRNKRTLGVFLQTFADAIGYDVQKRPSILPIAAPAAPKAPVPVPKAPAPAPRIPPPKAPAPPVLKTPAMPKAPPAPPAPARPAPAPKPPPAPAPKAPPAAAPRPAVPKAPPLLTETIQKMFNLNFNWNRNVQPSAAPPPRGPPPKLPPSSPPPAAPAPKAPAPRPPAPKTPAPPPPAPKTPTPSPPAPKAPPKGKIAPTRYYQESSNVEDQPNSIQDNNEYYDNQQQNYNDQSDNNSNEDNEKEHLQNNDYDYPAGQAVQVFWQNSPWNRNKIQYHENKPVPQYQEFTGPNGERGYHARYYHQDAHLDQKDDDAEPEHYSNQEQEEPQNYRNQEQEQPQQYRYQEQEQPQQYRHQEQEQPQQYRYQEQEEPQDYRNQEQEQPQHYRNQEQDDPQNYRNQEPQKQQSNEEDVNGDSSKASFQFDTQPRGFQPNYNHDQSGYYHPGLPLAVHGIHEDKVLVAWPAPFEIAGSELKSKKVVGPSQDRFAAASENHAYNYEPDSYGQYTFDEVPEPAKHEYDNYEAPTEPKIEEEFSKNAKLSEKNYGKKIKNVQIDRHTFHH